MNANTNKCRDCAHVNSYACAGCVNYSFFKPIRSKIYYESVQDMHRLPATYLEMIKTAHARKDGILLPEIQDVIFSPPATIVFWADGTKTVVKAIYDEFDPEKGLAMAIAKKAYGNKGSYFNRIKDWVDYYLEEDE